MKYPPAALKKAYTKTAWYPLENLENLDFTNEHYALGSLGSGQYTWFRFS